MGLSSRKVREPFIPRIKGDLIALGEEVDPTLEDGLLGSVTIDTYPGGCSELF